MANSKSKREEIERKKRLAFTLYVDNGFEQRMIAQITDISEVSISKWKKEGSWEEERRIAIMGPDKQMRRILKIYDTMLTTIESRDSPKNIPDTKEADILSKMAVTVEKLKSETSYFMKADVGKLFITFIQSTYGQEKAMELVEYWHAFLMSNA